DRQNFPEVSRGEVRADIFSARTFAADLDDTDHFFSRKNWRAYDFVNRLSCITTRFHTLKNGCVPGSGEIVVDLGLAFASRTSSERGVARQRDEADVFQRFGHEEVQMTPSRRESQDSDFIRA